MPDARDATSLPSRANLSPAIPIFRVENLEASIGYYVERLGFRLQWRGDPLASVVRDRMSIMLSKGDQGQPGTWVALAALAANGLTFVSVAGVLWDAPDKRGWPPALHLLPSCPYSRNSSC